MPGISSLDSPSIGSRRASGGGTACASGASKNGEGGRFRGTGELTEMQREFVTRVVSNGGNQAQAAREAGYSADRTDGWKLMQLPHVLAAVQAERERAIQAGANLAWQTMQSLMQPGVREQVRFQAARWVLEAAGHGLAARAIDAGLVHYEKPLTEMTLGELDALIVESSAKLAALKIVPALPVEAT